MKQYKNKQAKNRPIFNITLGFLELGQWDALLSLGCGTGEILVFFPVFSLVFSSLYCVSAGIPYVQLVLMETFFTVISKVFSFLFVFSFCFPLDQPIIRNLNSQFDFFFILSGSFCLF